MNSNAPNIIYATVNGASTDVFSGRRQLIGGWREADNQNPRASRYILQPADGRPCAMEAFVAALLAAGLDAPVLQAAIRAWLKADWKAALFPLSEIERARLTDEGGAA